MDIFKLIYELIEKEDVEKIKQILYNNKDKIPKVLYRKDNYGFTLLHKACKKGNKEIVELLIRSGADINIKNTQNNDTPLHETCRFYTVNKTEIVKLLLQSNADVNAKNIDDESPLNIACEYVIYRWGVDKEYTKDVVNVIKLLVQAGADVNTRNKENITPLHKACREGVLEVVELLIKVGADIEAKDKEGKTPLHYACEKGNKEIVELLIQSGANVNVEDNEKNTPLYYACKNGELYIAKLLVQSGSTIEKDKIMALIEKIIYREYEIVKEKSQKKEYGDEYKKSC